MADTSISINSNGKTSRRYFCT